MRKLALAVLLCASVLHAEEKSPQQLFAEARAAYDAKNYAGYLAAMDALVALRPGHPVVRFNHAGALALNGKAAEAVADLDRLARMQMVFDLADHDFDSIRDRDDFRAMAKQMDTLRARRISTSEVAFTFPQKDLITEAIAYDAKSKSFFVSAVRKRKILRIDARGNVTDFITSSVWGVNGLGLDAKRRILYASSAAYDRIENFDETKAANERSLFAFNADTGVLIARFDAPAGVFPDDLTVAPDGTVYLSDSLGSVLRLQPGAKALEVFVAKGTMRSPQGSAFANGILYVADYGGAIWAVDAKTAKAEKLDAPAELALIGIDGLEFHNGSLIAVQNGIEPNRVIRFDIDGKRIVRSQILEMNHPLMDEPTIGVVVNGDFYFLAASQGGKVAAKHTEELHDAVVLKTPLR